MSANAWREVVSQVGDVTSSSADTSPAEKPRTRRAIARNASDPSTPARAAERRPAASSCGDGGPLCPIADSLLVSSAAPMKSFDIGALA